MSGILYGVGVGPGDPELMTLKAVRLIKEMILLQSREQMSARLLHTRSQYRQFRNWRQRTSSNLYAYDT